MKKIIAPFSLLVVLLFSCFTLMAQKPMKPAEDRAAKLTEWMKTNLKLSDDQVTKVQDINLKYARKMDELHNSSQDKNAKMMAMKSDGEAKDGELKQVFTNDQYQAYEAKKADMKKQMKAEMKARKGGQ